VNWTQPNVYTAITGRLPSAQYRSTLDYPSTYGTIFGSGAKVIPSYSSAGNWTFPDFSQWDVTDKGGLSFRKEMPTFSDNLTLLWRLLPLIPIFQALTMPLPFPT
jgi:hypothetical protein